VFFTDRISFLSENERPARETPCRLSETRPGLRETSNRWSENSPLLSERVINKGCFGIHCCFLKVVDLRFRMLAFRGASGEPPRLIKPAGVSPVPLIPQESRTLHSNQHAAEGTLQKSPEATIF
jgi:hypothetical protein